MSDKMLYLLFKWGNLVPWINYKEVIFNKKSLH